MSKYQEMTALVDAVGRLCVTLQANPKGAARVVVLALIIGVVVLLCAGGRLLR